MLLLEFGNAGRGYGGKFVRWKMSWNHGSADNIS